MHILRDHEERQSAQDAPRGAEMDLPAVIWLLAAAAWLALVLLLAHLGVLEVG